MPETPKTFVIRIEQVADGVRGKVVAVATGAAHLFDDLAEAMVFIRTELQGHEEPVEREGRS